MHDILEGSLPLETKELIRYLISSKLCGIAGINQAIRSFAYAGADSANKLNPISSATLSSRDHLLKQTGIACTE